MKKLICIIIIISLLCGCKGENTSSDIRQEIKINYSTDNTVNGYRTESSTSSATDGKSPNFIPADEVVVESSAVQSTSVSYIGNCNSKVFHSVSCSSVKDMIEANKVSFKSRKDAVQKGFKPCGRCNP